MLKNEEWRQIDGYQYEVNRQREVRNIHTQQMKVTQDLSCGDKSVRLYLNGSVKVFRLSALLEQAFGQAGADIATKTEAANGANHSETKATPASA